MVDLFANLECFRDRALAAVARFRSAWSRFAPDDVGFAPLGIGYLEEVAVVVAGDDADERADSK